MKLLKAIPVLPAKNMRDTIDFYESKLRFKGFNLGNYAIIKSGFAEIHFSLAMDKNKMQPASCYICTDNVEDLYTFCAERELLYPPGQITDMKLGKKEFSIRDNNGNIIRFGELRQ
jgi:hypothetical protein